MDDVAVELVEAKLVKVLPDIFSPMTVCTMPPDLVGRIAGESDEKLRRREQLEKDLDILGKSSDSCKRFVGMNLVGETYCQASGFAQVRECADSAADVIIDGARAPESTSAGEDISEDEAVSVDEPLSDREPVSEVSVDSEVSQPHRSPERAASPDLAWPSPKPRFIFRE